MSSPSQREPSFLNNKNLRQETFLIASSEIRKVLQRRQILNLFEPPACRNNARAIQRSFTKQNFYFLLRYFTQHLFSFYKFAQQNSYSCFSTLRVFLPFCLAKLCKYLGGTICVLCAVFSKLVYYYFFYRISWFPGKQLFNKSYDLKITDKKIESLRKYLC